MRKFVASLVVAASLTLALVGSAMAHEIDPCSGGSAYAHHITDMVTGGGVNNPGAHKPGSHSGFAGLCLSLGR